MTLVYSSVARFLGSGGGGGGGIKKKRGDKRGGGGGADPPPPPDARENLKFYSKFLSKILYTGAMIFCLFADFKAFLRKVIKFRCLGKNLIKFWC